MKKISEVSALAGVSKRTLQYYDELGLLKTVRSNENDRLYSEKELETLVKILIYKNGGLKLQEIKEVLGLEAEKQSEYLKKHIDSLCNEIKELDEKVTFANYLAESGWSDVENIVTDKDAGTFSERVARLKRNTCAAKK